MTRLGAGMGGQPNTTRIKPNFRPHRFPDYLELYTRADFEACERDELFDIARIFRLRVTRRLSTERIVDLLVAKAAERKATW